MLWLKHTISSLLYQEDGQGMTEYGIILGGISIIAFAAVIALTVEMEEMYKRVINVIQGRHDH